MMPRTTCPCSNFASCATDEFVSGGQSRDVDGGTLPPSLFEPRRTGRFASPAGKSAAGLSSPFPKNIPLRALPKSTLELPPSCPTEGRLAIVTDAGRDAVDARRRERRTRVPRGRQSRVVLTPRRWCQVGGGNSADDGGKKARSPRRARRKPLKPLRGECRAISGVTVVTNSRVFYTPREAAGASDARHSLRPLIGEGRMFTAKLARNARRDREAVCAV